MKDHVAMLEWHTGRLTGMQKQNCTSKLQGRIF